MTHRNQLPPMPPAPEPRQVEHPDVFYLPSANNSFEGLLGDSRQDINMLLRERKRLVDEVNRLSQEDYKLHGLYRGLAQRAEKYKEGRDQALDLIQSYPPVKAMIAQQKDEAEVPQRQH